jgi:hypothetical protein
MIRTKNKNVDIKNDNGDVVVTDGKTEFYRAKKTEQTISIANCIYFANKYEGIENG